MSPPRHSRRERYSKMTACSLPRMLTVHAKPALFALLAILLGGPAGHAGADIWGYVDEHGVAHLARHQVDARYYLFKKEPPPAAAQETATEVSLPAPLPSVNPVLRRQYAAMVAAIAREHGLDAALLHAIIAVESAYNAKALSPRGAAGLMQLMPDTAERYAVKDIWNPLDNLRGGARYLRDLLALFGNDLSLALAAYNAGEGAVIGAGYRIPAFQETRDYVPRVLAHYKHYRVRSSGL